MEREGRTKNSVFQSQSKYVLLKLFARSIGPMNALISVSGTTLDNYFEHVHSSKCAYLRDSSNRSQSIVRLALLLNCIIVCYNNQIHISMYCLH